jgi:hypothetical protein
MRRSDDGTYARQLLLADERLSPLVDELGEVVPEWTSVGY